MGSKVIRVIRPIDNSAEKDYIKEFLRFIGCFLSDYPVETRILSNWSAALFPENEPESIDIVLNYFGDDLYTSECRNFNVKRIYCYFDFRDDRKWGQVASKPLSVDEVCDVIQEKSALRAKVLRLLVKHIWEDNSDICENILQIVTAYVGNTQGDMFQLIQAKTCLRVLTMGEVLKDPFAQVSKIQMDVYVKRILCALWELIVRLEPLNDSYSCYAKANASIMISDVVNKLYSSELVKINTIAYDNRAFVLPQPDLLKQQLWEIVNEDPEFLTAYLLLACCCKSTSAANRAAERCYHQILKSVPGDKRRCAFIWYRIGQFYEKKYFDTKQAITYYRKSVDTDPMFYQALFKLGYYAAFDGHFAEAEIYLNRTIQSIFCGRSTEPEENGEYENWLSLSLKNSQYVYKAYMLLAKIAVNSTREYSTRSFIGRACMAATRFEEAALIRHALDSEEFIPFDNYHRLSTPVWAMWQVLKPWSEDIIQDYFVRNIVQGRLARWKRAPNK